MIVERFIVPCDVKDNALYKLCSGEGCQTQECLIYEKLFAKSPEAAPTLFLKPIQAKDWLRLTVARKRERGIFHPN